jgi:hypothetical protein
MAFRLQTTEGVAEDTKKVEEYGPTCCREYKQIIKEEKYIMGL